LTLTLGAPRSLRHFGSPSACRCPVFPGACCCKPGAFVVRATEDKTIHFNQFENGTADRIRYQRVNERTGKEVDYDDIVKGHDLGGGDYVIVTDEELEDVEPGRSRTIDIADFVDLDEIDPIYFQKTYYVAPRAEEAGPAYRLLRKAMAATNKVGIANFVMRGKQYLVRLRADENMLALETMFFADEVRTPADEIDGCPASARSAPAT